MTTLLLHPIGLDRSTWDGVPIPDAMAVDLPGHGEAPLGSVASLAEVADAVVDGLPTTDPVDVVGLSLGGMVGLHLALRHPGRVRSLVVACAPAATRPDVFVQRALDTEGQGMEGMMAATLARWFSPAVLAAAPPARIVGDTVARLRSDDPHVVARYWRMLADHDVVARLGELSMPVTVVAGDRDLSVPPALARELAEGIDGARYVELGGAHMLHLEAPAPFGGAVSQHLAGVPV